MKLRIARKISKACRTEEFGAWRYVKRAATLPAAGRRLRREINTLKRGTKKMLDKSASRT